MRSKDMHLSEGEIRAYQDQELPASQSRHAEAHLASCPACQAKASEIQSRSNAGDRAIFSLCSLSRHHFNTPLPAAHRRLAERMEQEKEQQTMKPKTFLHLPRTRLGGNRHRGCAGNLTDLCTRPCPGKQFPGSLPGRADPRGPDRPVENA